MTLSATHTRNLPAQSMRSLFPGELVARYTYEGHEGRDTFSYRVLIGRLASSRAVFDEEHDGHVVRVGRAAGVEMAQSYTIARAGLAVIGDVRDVTDFHYDREVILRRVTAQDDVAEAVAALTDRHDLEAAGNNWQRSVLGLDAISAMQRALFVASGEPELNISLCARRALTDPEIRGNALNLAGALAINAYTNMPPQLS